MKLLELTGIKNQSDKEITDIIIDLIKKKYDFLGAGSFGTVFDNPKKSNEVIKFWIKDPAYEHFLKVAKSINSPHLIKVIKQGSITLNLESPVTIKYARLEKLNPVREVDGIYIDNFVFLISTTLDNYIEGSGHGRDFIQQMYQILKDNKNSVDDFMDFNEFSKDTIDCILVIKQLYDKAKHYNWDLHAGNIMKRGNTLVVVDPYYGHKAKSLLAFDKELYNYLSDLKFEKFQRSN